MADAIAIIRPASREPLLPYLDLDEADEEATQVAASAASEEEDDRVYAEELEDGSFLLHVFQPFEPLTGNLAEAWTWLEDTFGAAVDDLTTDPRGVLFFDADHLPDDPTAYDAVVAAVEATGFWIEIDDDADGDGDGESVDEPERNRQALAMLQQLLGEQGAAGLADLGAGKQVSSFDMGQMMEGMQRSLMDALGVDAAALLGMPGMPGAPVAPGEVIDSEFEPAPDNEKETPSTKAAPKK